MPKPITNEVAERFNRLFGRSGEEIRIFRSTARPAGDFGRIVEILSALEPPRWPVWMPGASNPSPEMQKLIEREIAPLLATTGPAQVVAASNLLGEILAAAAFPPGRVDPDLDWFSFLGLSASATLTACA